MDNKVEKKIMESFSEEIRKQVDIINRKMQDIVANLPISLENRLARTSAPLFDGSGSYDLFKFQFDLVAEKNAWNHSDKGIEMVLALKGNALEVLRGISYSNRTNYTKICTALQQKYGDPSIVPMQLENHSQKPNESLEEFAKSLELLMPISSTENNPIVDQMRAKTFINGIRDPQIRRPLMAASQLNFTDAIAFAQVLEKHRLITEENEMNIERMKQENIKLISQLQILENSQRALDTNKTNSHQEALEKEIHTLKTALAELKNSVTTGIPSSAKHDEEPKIAYTKDEDIHQWQFSNEDTYSSNAILKSLDEVYTAMDTLPLRKWSKSLRNDENGNTFILDIDKSTSLHKCTYASVVKFSLEEIFFHLHYGITITQYGEERGVISYDYFGKKELDVRRYLRDCPNPITPHMLILYLRHEGAYKMVDLSYPLKPHNVIFTFNNCPSDIKQNCACAQNNK